MSMCRSVDSVGEFDTDRKPVGGDDEEFAGEGLDEWPDGGVRHQDIEIAVLACLGTDQCIDSPTAGDDRSRSRPRRDIEHPQHVSLRGRHLAESGRKQHRRRATNACTISADFVGASMQADLGSSIVGAAQADRWRRSTTSAAQTVAMVAWTWQPRATRSASITGLHLSKACATDRRACMRCVVSAQLGPSVLAQARGARLRRSAPPRNRAVRAGHDEAAHASIHPWTAGSSLQTFGTGAGWRSRWTIRESRTEVSR